MTGIRLKSIIKTPASIVGSDGITVDNSGGVVTIGLDEFVLTPMPLPFNVGDMLYASSPTTLDNVTPNTTLVQKILAQTGDGTTAGAPQWVATSLTVDPSKVSKGGDTMSGALVLPGNPVNALEAAPKQYVDTTAADRVARSGDTMGGDLGFAAGKKLILAQDPVAALEAVTKQYVDVYAAPFDTLAYNGMQINGSMEVQQFPPAAVYNVLDGWGVVTSGPQVISGAPNTAAPSGYASSIQVFATTANASPAAGNVLAINHRIEGYRVLRLAWGTVNAQPVTIGFWVYSTKAGLYSGSVRNSASDRSYVFSYTIIAASTFEYKTITIPGDITGTWLKTNGIGLDVSFALMSGGTFSVAAGSWQAGNYVAAPGQVNVIATTSDFVLLTGVVVLPGLEAPSAARSPFIMRPFDQELELCKRYYFKSYPYATVPGTAVSAGSNTIFLAGAPGGTHCSGHVVFPQTMRVVPTLTTWSNVGISGQVSYYTSTWLNGGTVFAIVGSNGIGFNAPTSGVANMYNFDMVADARL